MHEFSYSLSRGETRIITGKSVHDGIMELPEDSLIVYPKSVSRIIEPHLDGTSFSTHFITDGEEGKSMDSVLGIISSMREAGFRRTSTLVSVGGGSTSDAAGMAASMYMRGVGYVSIPTTLLAMVDASLGGKNAVNFTGVKNLLGSFYSPSQIIIDTSLVKDMPPALITDGMGEIAKYAINQDSELFDWLVTESMEDILGNPDSLEELISRCVSLKMDMVTRDEFDLLGERIILNFGHTLGHALESATGFTVGHGTAVAHGMLLELDMGVKLGLIGDGLLHKAETLLGRLSLPDRIDHAQISSLSGRMFSVVSSDKKATRESLKLPLPVELGKCRVFDIELKEVGDYLRNLKG